MPTGYREVFVDRGGQGVSGEEALDMVCVCPGDDRARGDVVGEGVIVSTSEMAVRYGMMSHGI